MEIKSNLSSFREGMAFTDKGASLEAQLGRLAGEATDWKVILPMMAGSAVYQISKTLALARWAQNGSKAWYVSRVPARLSAAWVGFGPEVAVFTGLNHSFQKLGTESGEPSGPLARELLSAGITLGTLKIFAYAGHQAMAHPVLRKNLYPFQGKGARQLGHFLLPQASIFSGLMTAHRLEEKIGWRSRLEGVSAVTGTLASMFSLGFGSHLGHRILGPRFQAFQREQGLRARLWEQKISRPGFVEGMERLFPRLRIAATPGGPHLWMMQGGEKGGGESGGSPSSMGKTTESSLRPAEDLLTLSADEIRILLQRADHGDTHSQKCITEGLKRNPDLMEDFYRKLELDQAAKLFRSAHQEGHQEDGVLLLDLVRRGEGSVYLIRDMAQSGDTMAMDILADALRFNPHAVFAMKEMATKGQIKAQGGLQRASIKDSRLSFKLSQNPRDKTVLTAFANLIEAGNREALEVLRETAEAGNPTVIKILFGTAKNSQNPFKNEVWHQIREIDATRLKERALQDPEAIPALNLLRRLDHRDAARFLRQEMDYEALTELAKTDDEFLYALKQLTGFGIEPAEKAFLATATHNPHTIFYLDELAYRFQEGRARQALQDLDVAAIDWRARPKEWAEALALLVDGKHPGALALLEEMAPHEPLAQVQYQRLRSLGFDVQGPKKKLIELPPPEFTSRPPREIWEEYLKARPPEDVPPPKFPYYINHRTPSLARAVEAVVRFVPPEIKCIYIDVVGKELKDIGNQLKPVLEKKKTLEEIRLRFLDGSLTWVARVDGEVKFEKGELMWVRSEEEAIVTEREALPDEDPIFNGTDRPKEEIFRVRLLTPWTKLNGIPDFPQFLRELRENRGLYLEEVVEKVWEDPNLAQELATYKNKTFVVRNLEDLEKGRRVGRVQFPVLKRLAEVLHTDVRKLTIARNKYLFPNIPRKYWSTEDYPIFLEASDLKRVSYFMSLPNGHFRNSYGFKIWAGRKDPFNYYNLARFAKALRWSSSSMITDVELDRRPPSRELHQGISAVLTNVQESELLRSLYRTHYPQVPLEEFFYERLSFMDPQTKDPEKVALFQREPETIGEFLFRYRHSLPWYPTLRELAEEIGTTEDVLQSREFNRVGILPENFFEWVSLFEKMGLPLELLESIAERNYGIPRDGNIWVFARALEGKTTAEISTLSGVSHPILLNIIHDRGTVPQPNTLLRLKEVLPNLDAGLLYLRFHPEILQFFPELQSDQRRVLLTPIQIERAFESFHLGEALFAFRMNPGQVPGLSLQKGGTVSRKELVRYSGITNPALLMYETAFSNIEKDETLLRLAGILGIDPKILYLHFRPEILGIFPVEDPDTGKRKEVTSKEFKEILEKANNFYDRKNLNYYLKNALKEVHQDPIFYLSQLLGLSPAVARNIYEFGNYSLSPEHIKRLAENLPGISYTKWYEHFNRASLHFFLGRTASGSFDYGLPSGWTWESLDQLDMVDFLKNAQSREELNPRETKRVWQLISRVGETISLDNIMSLAKWKQVDQRLLFLWARRHELRPMVEATLSVEK